MNRFIEGLQVVSTNNYNATAHSLVFSVCY
jgi:hypothetical protein